MGNSILIFFVFFAGLSFAQNKIDNYFGLWKGEIFYSGKEYELYVSFPGLGESASGYYKASEKKDKNKVYTGYFWVRHEKENFYKAKIRTNTNKLKIFIFPVEGKFENGEIILDSFLVKGRIMMKDIDTILFSFVNEFGEIEGKLRRLAFKKKQKEYQKKTKL